MTATTTINQNKQATVMKKGRGRPKGSKNVSHPQVKRPKRPLSAYNLFYRDVRAKMNDEDVSFTTLGKVVGDQWKNVDSNRKALYEHQAAKLLQVYKEQMKIYDAKVKEIEETNYQEYKPEISKRILERAIVSKTKRTTKFNEDQEVSTEHHHHHHEQHCYQQQQQYQQPLYPFLLNAATYNNTMISRQTILNNIISPFFQPNINTSHAC